MTSTSETASLLNVRAVTKAFGTTIACDEVNLCVSPGEIHALLGENGAGKSTLVKMLFGALQPDAGTIEWQGRAVSIRSPSHARSLGIAMVFQHFSLFEPLTVAENIALALDDTKGLRNIAREAREISERYGLPVDPHALIGDLAAGQRQRVEIVRALMQNPRLLILDEPTSVLTPQEAEVLFTTLRRMREEGRSVLYISHRLEEVQRLCDNATVLRRGRLVDTCRPSAESAQSLATMMVGSKVEAVSQRVVDPGPTILSVVGLDAPAETPFSIALSDVRIDVRAGEVACIAGVAGNGQSELFAVLSGERTVEQTMMTIAGEEIGHLGISARRRRNAAFVPEERIGHGSIGDMALSRNLLLARHASDGSSLLRTGIVGVIREGRVRELGRKVVNGMDVRGGEGDPIAGSLSGGNLQKFIVGRELDRAPALLVIDQPSWGVDAGAAAALRQALMDLAADGAAVLVISHDLDEIFEIATHVCVMDAGRLSGKVRVGDTDRETLGLLMGGHGNARDAA